MTELEQKNADLQKQLEAADKAKAGLEKKLEGLKKAGTEQLSSNLKTGQKMYRFIKDHVSGIGKGTVRPLDVPLGDRLIREKYCENAAPNANVVIKDSHVESAEETLKKKEKARKSK